MPALVIQIQDTMRPCRRLVPELSARLPCGPLVIDVCHREPPAPYEVVDCPTVATGLDEPDPALCRRSDRTLHGGGHGPEGMARYDFASGNSHAGLMPLAACLASSARSTSCDAEEKYANTKSRFRPSGRESTSSRVSSGRKRRRAPFS